MVFKIMLILVKEISNMFEKYCSEEYDVRGFEEYGVSKY